LLNAGGNDETPGGAASCRIAHAVHLCADRRMRPVLYRLHCRTGVLLVAVLASRWFVYMWVAFNQQFVHDYLLAGNLWYFTA
jgi:hypothetical protein